MRAPRDLRIRDAVMALLLPCLAAASVAFGWVTWRTLYDLILAGFEARLVAVSTVTGSFIEGDEHAALLKRHALVGLTAVPGRPYLMGLDTVGDALVAVDRVQGGARTVVPVAADSLRGLVAAGGLLLTRHLRLGWSALDTVSGTWRPLTGRETRQLGEILGPAAVPEPLRDITRNPVTGATRMLAGTPPALFAPSDTGMMRLGAVRGADTLDSTVPVDGLAYDADGVLFAAGMRLVELDAATGTVAKRTFVDGFRSEGQPAYQRYVRPMRRVARSEDITYLYTQVVDASGRVHYVLDATQGPEHSYIGDEEDLPAREVAPTLSVQTDGGVYITGLKQWAIWGFLKSADAPIVDALGRPVAMVGADVDISNISRRTRGALARVVLLAVGVLVLGGSVSLWLSRRVTVPLDVLKDGALGLAAGRMGTQVAEAGPREVRWLTARFNEMSRVLDGRIRELREQGAALDRARILRRIDAESGDEASERTCPRLETMRNGGSPDPSGTAPTHGGALVWLADAEDDSARALRVRATVRRLAERVAPADDPLAIFPGLQRWSVHTLAFLRSDGSVALRTTCPSAVRIDTCDGGVRGDGSIVEVRPGVSVELTAGGGAGGFRFRAVVRDGGRRTDPSGVEP